MPVPDRDRWLRAAVWSVVLPGVRARASRRLAALEAGVATVVTVNWNSAEQLRTLLRLVRSRSPERTRILVVDNHSRDESRALLSATPDVEAINLPINLGHDLALDIGFLAVRTEFVVALDVDAFPLHGEWLRELLQPLDSSATIAGARLNREYVHPCCLAMRTRTFVERKHSFRNRYRPRRDGKDASGDVGEIMSQRETPRLFFFDPTSQRGPGDVGTVFGGLVYHNFYSTRFNGTDAVVLDDHVRQSDAEAAWNEAVERYGRET
jgi:glycosyltransferase involved in cell wall biosynthesis